MRKDNRVEAGFHREAAASPERAGLPEGPSALMIGHPGHELRVFGWLGIARPSVFILTDGSGRSGKSRIGSTSKILESAGARYGSIYGRLTDKEAYDALLNQEFGVFLGRGSAQVPANPPLCGRGSHMPRPAAL